MDAFYIGGSKLSKQDTRQLVDNLVKQYAKTQFISTIEGDTAAFQQALRRETTKHSVELREMNTLLIERFNIGFIQDTGDLGHCPKISLNLTCRVISSKDFFSLTDCFAVLLPCLRSC